MEAITIVKSAYQDPSISVIEMDVSPGTGNPKHYHNLFNETFEIIEGELYIGSGKLTTTLKAGQKITVPMGAVHFFKNKTSKVCKIRVTLQPGNTDFEDAMLIYYGLKKDWLLSKSGTPKSFTDLAIFIKLNNSKMKGLGKIAELLFNTIANRATRNGRLKQLKDTYTSKK
jgi:quercetin dioxygenase-like cupin family protein